MQRARVSGLSKSFGGKLSKHSDIEFGLSDLSLQENMEKSNDIDVMASSLENAQEINEEEMNSSMGEEEEMGEDDWVEGLKFSTEDSGATAPTHKKLERNGVNVVGESGKVVKDFIHSVEPINTLKLRLEHHLDLGTPPPMINLELKASIGNNLEYFRPRERALKERAIKILTKEYMEMCKGFMAEREAEMHGKIKNLLGSGNEHEKKAVKQRLTNLMSAHHEKMKKYVSDLRNRKFQKTSRPDVRKEGSKKDGSWGKYKRTNFH
jgi:hypothetical protein